MEKKEIMSRVQIKCLKEGNAEAKENHQYQCLLPLLGEISHHLNLSQRATWLTVHSLNVELKEVLALFKDCQGEQRGNTVLSLRDFSS